MKTLNNLLQRQINKCLGSNENIPKELTRLVEIISDTYDHAEKERKMLEHSIEISSTEMKELNIMLKNEAKENNKILFEKLKDSLTLLNDRNTVIDPHSLNYQTLAEVANELKTETVKRVQIEKEHSKQKAHLEACQRIAKIGSWEVDLPISNENQSFYLSDETYRIFGIAPGASMQSGNTPFSRIHPEEQQVVQDAYDRSIETGLPLNLIHRVVLPDNTPRIVHEQAEVFLDPITQKPLKIIGTIRDITEEKAAQQKIDQIEETKKIIMESSMDAIVCCDVAGIITFWSSKAEKLFGWTEGEIIGKQLVDTIIPPQYREKHVAGMKHHLESGEGSILNSLVELTALTKDNIEFPIELTIVSIQQNDRQLFCAFIHDITNRKAAEDKIHRINRMYSFISQINQTIVQVVDQAKLLDEACRIAIENGEFAAAWIAMPNQTHKALNIVAYSNIDPLSINKLNKRSYENSGPTEYVLNAGKPYVINDFEKEQQASLTKTFALEREFKSCIVLPIKQASQTVGTYNLFSDKVDVFDSEEIRLLIEASGDISFALDVFERDREKVLADERLRYSEFRLKQAQATAHFGSWELDFTTGEAVWSEEACRIYGFDPDDNFHSQETWFSIIHPEDLEYVKNLTKESQEKLSNSSFYHRIKRKDGTVRHLHSQANFEFNSNGVPIGLYGVLHDITEIKEIKEALVQSEANFRQIVDLIPQSIYVIDSFGYFIFVNESFANLYGFTQNDLIGKSVNEIAQFDASSSIYLKEDSEILLSGISNTILDYSFVDYIGRKKCLNITRVPYTIAGLNEKAILGVINDITEQQEIASERTKMIADIVQRNKDLEQFSYIVSHNLRAPVANISGLVEVLQIPDLDIATKRNFIVNLGESVNKLDSVIMDLNYVLQIKHKENKKKEWVRFSEILNSIKLSINNLIKNEAVEIIDDFSAIDDVNTLKSYIYSIFFNLISNSIKYRKQDVPPVIMITSSLSEDKIHITFKDNGLGVDLKAKSDLVFGLYKRFHNHVDGKGMGLFMVKTQVESIGGSISIASELNKGTEFTIELPTN